MKKKIFILSLLFLNLSLFSVPGDWKQLGKPGEWKGTIAGAVISNSLYTVEQDGTLYVTDLTNGKWTKIGKQSSLILFLCLLIITSYSQ